MFGMVGLASIGVAAYFLLALGQWLAIRTKRDKSSWIVAFAVLMTMSFVVDLLKAIESYRQN
jgi:hypothetical protein